MVFLRYTARNSGPEGGYHMIDDTADKISRALAAAGHLIADADEALCAIFVDSATLENELYAADPDERAGILHDWYSDAALIFVREMAARHNTESPF